MALFLMCVPFRHPQPPCPSPKGAYRPPEPAEPFPSVGLNGEKQSVLTVMGGLFIMHIDDFSQ